MKIARIKVENIRCFTRLDTEFSNSVNVITGLNNAGKTTLVNCLAAIQQPFQIDNGYKRIRTDSSKIQIFVIGNTNGHGVPIHERVDIFPGSDTLIYYEKEKGSRAAPAPNREPQNIIIPFTSKRKVGGYSQDVRREELDKVTGTLDNLYAKIDNISNPNYKPGNSRYVKACSDIIGFQVSATSSANGKKGVYIIENEEQIPIDAMGEGVSNLLGLIIDLCKAKDKIFIIEEPENDIHPKALKGLLSLILEQAKDNQFFITTHSNIVLKMLGSDVDSKVFKVTQEFENKIPTSVVSLAKNREERLEILEELGYELLDLDLWEKWLFLEESSAERIIRDYLIPWFLPHIKKQVRTFSMGGINSIKSKFENFHNLFVYLHLSPIYKGKAFVIVDGGDNEAGIISDLKKVFIPKGWEESSFCQFTKHDFESYYPESFKPEIERVLGLKGSDKREEKKVLLNKVIAWIKSSPEEEAKEKFKDSASEVIELLLKLFPKES